jgi:predicted kinase
VSEPLAASGARMLLQLSGVPGTGKSTLARGLARQRAMVVLDKDVVMSSLLAVGVPLADAGRASYSCLLGLAADLLAQGHGVVLDSPCRYRTLLESGQGIAAAAGVPYRLVELWADDPADLLPRLDLRTALPSQVASADDPVPGSAWELRTPLATLAGWQDQLVRPESGWLRLDALLPPEEVLQSTLDYLGAVGVAGGECGSVSTRETDPDPPPRRPDRP